MTRAPSRDGAPVVVRRRGAELWARLVAGKRVVVTACHGRRWRWRNGGGGVRRQRGGGGELCGSAAQMRGRRTVEGLGLAFKGARGATLLGAHAKESQAAAAARRVRHGHGDHLGPDGPERPGGHVAGPATRRRNGLRRWATLGPGNGSARARRRVQGAAANFGSRAATIGLGFRWGKSRGHQQTLENGLGPIGKKDLIISRNYF